ncbi:MAG: hypothetical protein U0174_11090 [Polyangiaceae bacterium]
MSSILSFRTSAAPALALLCAITAGCAAQRPVPYAPEAPKAKRLTLEEARALDTTSLPTHKVDLLGHAISVEGIQQPQVKVELDDAGAQAATMIVPIAAGRPPVICFANEHFRSFGATMRVFFTGILKEHPMRVAAQELSLQGDAAHPLVRFDAVFTTEDKAAAPFQVVFAPLAARSAMCVLEGLAYHDTLLRISKEALFPLSDLEPKAVYAELKLIRMNKMPIGFEWSRLFDRGNGQYGYQSMSGTFGLAREGLLFHDSLHEARIDERGLLTRAETQTLDNNGKSASVLERTTKGGIYTRFVGGREQKTEIAQMPTSDLEDARIYRKVAKGDKKTATPTFPDGEGKILPIVVSREGEKTLLLKYKEEVTRCELDDDGRCSRKTSGDLVRERISTTGTFPKLP